MSEAGVGQLVEAYYAALASGDAAALAVNVVDDYRHHAGQHVFNLDTLSAMLSSYRDAFSDFVIAIDRMVTQDGWTAVRTTAAGRHTGLFLGHAPTWRTFSAAGSDFLRIEHGRVAEAWTLFDTIGMLQQLGLYRAAA
jgi:steroid delta-isomerase-like uncharacterized protein